MTTAAIKWHGGKSYLAKRIIELLPPRDSWHLWREPFFGGGAVTLALDPDGLSEAVNDLHGELINFWKVLACHDKFPEFERIAALTPFAEEAFESSEDRNTNPRVDSWSQIESAVSFFVRCRQSRQGLMRDFATPTRRTRRGMNENVSAWLSAVEGLPEIHERLKRIEIRNMDAWAFIQLYDDERAVFYCDPPYMLQTRSTGGGEYKHEMSASQHSGLLNVLAEIEGRFLLSGYRSDLYDSMANANGWRRVDIQIDNKASGKKSKEVKTECVWMNY